MSTFPFLTPKAVKLGGKLLSYIGQAGRLWATRDADTQN